jgi:hypothetical protein
MPSPQVELQAWLDQPQRPCLTDLASPLERLLLMQAEDVELLAAVWKAVSADWSQNAAAWPLLLKAVDQALTKEAMYGVFTHVLPELVALLESVHEQLPAVQVHMAYRLIVRYQHLEGMELLLRLSRRGDHVHGAAWYPLFESIRSMEPLWRFTVHRLQDKPPAGDCGIGFLTLCVDLVRAHELDELPHATDRGCQQLQRWIEDQAHPERALAAIAALPHIGAEWQSLFLGLASEHQDPEVALAAAQASAALGKTAALATLVQQALHQGVTQVWAQDALYELGQAPLPAAAPQGYRLALDAALLVVDLMSRGLRTRGWQVCHVGEAPDGQRCHLVRVTCSQQGLRLDRFWLLGSGSPWEVDAAVVADANAPAGAPADNWAQSLLERWPQAPAAQTHVPGWHHRRDAARLHSFGSQSL